MSQVYLLVLAFAFFAFLNAEPVKDGNNAVQTNFPYVVNIKLMQLNNKVITKTFHCTGVIIGKKTVLTAAHCFLGLKKLIGHVHAGIADVKLENEEGQRIVMKDFHIHEEYRKGLCPVGKRYCNTINDLAIIWLHEEFDFGPKIKKAELNTNLKRPENKMGWILGWGNKKTSKLQRGLMKLISQEECQGFSQYWHIPKTYMCLKSQVGLDTRSEKGDSGGPFVISGVVHGICSQALYTESSDKTLDVFTDVARYNNWILRNLDLGPPIERN